MDEAVYRAGDVIIAQGDVPDRFYLLEVGAAVATVHVPGVENALQVAEFSRGSYFGELELFSKKKRTATVTATTSTRCARPRPGHTGSHTTSFATCASCLEDVLFFSFLFSPFFPALGGSRRFTPRSVKGPRKDRERTSFGGLTNDRRRARDVPRPIHPQVRRDRVASVRSPRARGHGVTTTVTPGNARVRHVRGQRGVLERSRERGVVTRAVGLARRETSF
jgi:hypothetical protein